MEKVADRGPGIGWGCPPAGLPVWALGAPAAAFAAGAAPLDAAGRTAGAAWGAAARGWTGAWLAGVSPPSLRTGAGWRRAVEVLMGFLGLGLWALSFTSTRRVLRE